MKKKNLLFPVLAAMMFAGCSNDDVLSGNVPKTFTGDEAYIKVRLSDAGSQTRATTSDTGYEYGTETEHNVTNAHFYFYDEDGVFVSEGSAWNNGTASTGDPTNIEFESNNVVVLKGLTKKNYPKYMVTVLNLPSDFTPGETLEEMETTLTRALDAADGTLDSDQIVGIKGKNGLFTMSTTSWAEQGNVQTDYKVEEYKYFVTEVQEKNFSLEPIDHTENSNNYVTVYVERLAAKVTLDVSSSLTPEDISGKKYYKIKATVAGEYNAGNDVAAEDLYVELLGWKLNATAKRSNIVKNIDETWENPIGTSAGSFGFVWNKPSDFRSFWGMSFNYGKKVNYPTGYANITSSDYLQYFNLNKDLLELQGYDYCAENTNTVDILNSATKEGKFLPSAVTSILLKARVCDEKGNSLNLVRFNGILFKEKSFLKYILNAMKAKGNLKLYVKEAISTGELYKQIDESNVKLDNVGDGKVKVVLNEGLMLYVPDNDDTSLYKFADADDIKDFANRAETESEGAIGYKGGLMYYNIPIEHLNNNEGVDGKIPEAKYGVVRNHYYKVTINKLENIGKGIFDPDEVIVPGPDDDKETYYVGADIKILSWKIVSQTVDL